MTTQQLYRQGQYRQIVEMVNVDSPGSDDDLLRFGWAYHQLGEYDQSIPIMRGLRAQYSSDTDIGDSARRGLAHGLQQLGQIEDANEILSELLPSLARDNVRAVAIQQEVRNGALLPMVEAQDMISGAMWTVPRQGNNNAHIINNLAYAMCLARNQEAVKPYIWMLPGLMEVAMGIYEEVGAQKNHLASCLARTCEVFLDATDWREGALIVIQQSIKLWEELCASEGGERYQRDLESARAQLRRVEERRNQLS